MSIKDDYLILQQEVILDAIEEDEKAQQAKAINKLDFLLLKKAIFDKEFYSTNESLTYLVRLLDVLPDYDGFRSEHDEVKTIAKSITCRDMYAISDYKSLLLSISSAKRQMFSLFGKQAEALIEKIQKEKNENIAADEDTQHKYIFTPADERFLETTWNTLLNLKEEEEEEKNKHIGSR